MMGLNNRTIPVICVTMWLAVAGVMAQGASVLTLEELDDDGKTTNLDGKPLAIVDINSEIKVRLDPNALRTGVAQLLGPDAVSDELINRAAVLKEASQMGRELIVPLTQALENWIASPKGPNDVYALSEELNKSAEAKLEIIKIAKKDPTLSARLNATYEKITLHQHVSRAALSRAVFEAAADYAGELRQTIDEALQKEGAYVQLGAWIVQDGQDRPLHLRGFDTYPEGDFFVVDRWTLLPLSESQKQQLEDMEKAAKTFNKEGIGELLKVDGAANKAVAGILKRVRDRVEEIEAALTSAQNAVEAGAKSIHDLLDEIKREQEEYKGYVLFLERKYGGYSDERFASGAALLESTHDDLVQIQNRTTSFVTSQLKYLNAIETKIKESDSVLKDSLAQVEKQVSKLIGDVADSTEGLTMVMEMLLSAQEINTAVLEFGEEVLRHTLDKVPHGTELKLKRAGMRKVGDVVVLKLAAGGAKKQREVLEERRLDLYQVLPHVEMSIGMIFADPLGTTAVRNRFQAGPSYSILLKGFGNREATYNRLLTPGFGLNVAALDFDKDDTPELGVALVGSVFHDYLQVGYGYNVNEDVDYWFFGLRLPLSIFTLPSGESRSLP